MGALVMTTLPHLDAVEAAVASLASRLDCVGSENLPTIQCAGRVLAEPLLTDRDSPAIDVSAMDGYAVRLADVGPEPLPVAHTIAAGSPPLPLPAGYAMRIFTGAPVPPEADCVVRREDTRESPDRVVVQCPVEALQLGQHIRRRGENALRGSTALLPGTLLNPPAMGAVATFAPVQLRVMKKVRVAVLNTGDELATVGASVMPWQIRDSNGPLLEAWLKQMPWVEMVGRWHVGDTLEAVQATIAQRLPQVDALLLTGGVSMGDADFVPTAIENMGGEIAFHRLPIRPGRPVLGASQNGKLLVGLPGNPVSVAVTSRLVSLPLLRKLAGFSNLESPGLLVSVSEPDAKTLTLTWYRLVNVDPAGKVTLCSSQGSGDLVSLGLSQGFIEQPPGQCGSGPWKLTLW